MPMRFWTFGRPEGALGGSSFHLGELEREAGMRQVINSGKGQGAGGGHCLVPDRGDALAVGKAVTRWFIAGFPVVGVIGCRTIGRR